MRRLTEGSGPPITELPQPTWIFDRIEEWAKRFPNRFAFAMDHQDRVEEYRYADVLREIAAVQETLTSKGIVPGDRIGILNGEHPAVGFRIGRTPSDSGSFCFRRVTRLRYIV